MGFVRNVWNYLTNNSSGSSPSIPLSDDRLLGWLGIDRDAPESIHEATYFTCMKMLSETMGKLPLHYYQHTDGGRVRAKPTQATRLLTVRPNAHMTPTTLFTVTEFLCNHYGNAYIYIHSEFERQGQYGGQMVFKGLYPLHPSNVTIYIDNKGIFKSDDPNAVYYEYREPTSGKSYILKSSEVMHFKTWYSKNGIVGEPVRKILSETIGTAGRGQKVMNNLYENGLTAAMVMQYTSDLDDDRVKKLQKKFADKLTGPEAAGKVIPIPIGLQLQKLDTKLTDAQFYELRQYSALQIAAAFGIKPNQINDYSKSSYANSEQQQIAFLVDTMQYRLKSYEEEINSKILLPAEQENGFFYKFNERAILRADSETQMKTLAQGVNNALYTPNEGRSYLDLPDKEGGDILMCNGNYIPLTMVGEQFSTSEGGE